MSNKLSCFFYGLLHLGLSPFRRRGSGYFLTARMFAVCTVILYLGGTACAGENLLKYSDMEKNTSNWLKPTSWNGKLVQEKNKEVAYRGEGYLKLTPTASDKGLYGKIYLWLPRQNRDGQIFRFSIYVKGRGTLHYGTLDSFIASNGRIRQKNVWEKAPVQLTEQWQQVVWMIDLSQKVLTKFSPLLELRGEGVLYMDDMKMERLIQKEARITALTPLQIVPANGTVPAFEYRTAPGAPVILQQSSEKQPPRMISAHASQQGQVKYSPGRAGKAESLPQVITASCHGATAQSYLYVMPPEKFAENQKKASEIRLQKPIRILFLGDSLSDYDRGSNYIDRLQFWLNQNHPGKVSIRNAGVRGDHIVRVHKRLAERTGRRSTYRQEEYDHLFDQHYDLIFIFLGQNDTISYSTDKFEHAQIGPVQQRRFYLKVLEIIGRESKAPVVLISSASLNYDICKAKADKAMKRGRKRVYCFGNPARLEAFNQVLKKIAEEKKLDYLDLYTPMAACQQKASLLREDGVHLTSKGQDFVTGVILDYLKTKFK